MAESLSEYRRSSLGELLAAKMTLEATLDALPDPVLVFGPDQELVAANPPARLVLAALGTANNAPLGSIPFSNTHRETVELAIDGEKPTAQRANFQQTLNVVVDGQSRRYLLRAVPIPEFTLGRAGAVVVLDDVTEFARLDELRSELIGVASHELKSPLTALKMNLLMLGENSGDMSGMQQQLIADAVRACEELGSTIEELLDVTRIEAGQLRLNLVPVDLTAVLGVVCTGLQVRFDDAGIKLIVEREAVPAVVMGDPARLGSVLANVLGNALKYSSTGGIVKVELSSGQNAGDDKKPQLQIAVMDQGPGIPEEYRERVFEKFFRVEHHIGHLDNSVRGTGIGLYLSREVMKAHGGTIFCEPGDGGIGTRFVITLPVAD
jgi:NtrC-family two-component system sensor histidine kinase KinB